MYLYYYLKEKLVGTVDIEVFLELKERKTLIVCSEDDENLLCSLELMYGKRIERNSKKEIQSLKRIGPASHVFTTRRCGKELIL